MEEKKHFKLFKAGKKWCTMAIATLAVAAGTAVMAGTASADEAVSATASQPVQTAQVANGQSATGTADQAASQSDQPANPATGNDKQTNQQPQRQVDYRTPVNAANVDGASADKDGNVVFNGWHATNQYQEGMHHFVIVLDGGNNHELYRHEVTTVERPDIDKAYPKAPIAGQGGFTIAVPADWLNGANSLRLVSRYTSDATGNPAGGSDYWFPVVTTKAGWLDQFKVDGNQITVSGWHVDDQAASKTEHTVILWDKTKGREVARTTVDNVASADLPKVGYATVANGAQARFTASFTITPAMMGDEFTIVSRYNKPGQQDNNTSDLWLGSLKINKTGNTGYLDNFSVDKANKKINVSGWHADDMSAAEPTHTLILFDLTTNKEVTRKDVATVASPDIAHAYRNVYNAGKSRFNVQFDLTPAILNHQLEIISRYSQPGKGNESGHYSDYWFNNNRLSLTTNKQGHLDQFYLDKANKKVVISGWHADDASALMPTHFITLYDKTTGKELAHQIVKNIASPDIAAYQAGITNAGQSRFSTSFDITPEMVGHQLMVISRYSDSTSEDDYGHHSDYQFNNELLNFSVNQAAHLDKFTIDQAAGKVNISGWHADDASIYMPGYFIILFDKTANREIAHQQVATVASPDIAHTAYGNIANAAQCRFNVSFDIVPEMVGHDLLVISRYSNSNTNRYGSATSDYWFSNQTVNFPVKQQAYLENFRIDKAANKVYVSGWHADDASVYMPGHYVILFDKTTGREIAHKLVPVTTSPDIMKATHITNSEKARFNTSFDITPEMVGHELEIISRYSNSDTENYGTATSDYWFSNQTVNFAVNQKAYLEQFSLDAANRKINVSGWHADDASVYMPGHYVILFDKTANHEVAHQLVPVTASPDIAKFTNIANADRTRFSTSFDITPAMLNHTLVVISRYSNSATEDYGTATSDYWFNNQINLNQQNGWLDSFSQNGTTISATGWHVANSVVGQPHHVILLWDYSRNREVARHEVTNVASPDLASSQGSYLNARQARFSTSFTVDPSMVHDCFGIISRYSNQADGEGSTSQLWLTNRYLNAYQNPSWMYQINYQQIQANPAEVGHNIGPGYEGVKTWFIKSRLGTANIHNQYTMGDAYAIMNIQRSHGLPATGWVDLPTWRALGYSDDLWYGIDSYVQPLQVTNPAAGRQAHIEAMINAAYQYMGKPWWAGCSSAPAWGVDCSGLVMQALYAAGINPTSASSTHHGYPGNEWNSRNLFTDPHFANVGWNDRQRGDLVFYYEPGTRTIWHVAILLDPNTVIESWPPSVMVQPILNGQRNVIAGIRRVFA
ncbi:NlpC/P60 family protein [Limosilactobacillus antri]|uniref:NlpC/P60 family protein n=1 Tax=Limosilactobacillus antri TaxID=227943 RepID=UPI001F572076|nr:NlpC/P60 family protein [Limosilactobacillus antri]